MYKDDKSKTDNKLKDDDRKKGEKKMLVQDAIFTIPKDKSNDFLIQFKDAKISNNFLEECRKAASNKNKTINSKKK